MFTRVVKEDKFLLVPLATLKQHCRVDFEDDDEVLTMYLNAAHYAAGEYTRRRMFRTEAAAYFDDYSKTVFLPGGNVASAEGLTATNPNGEIEELEFKYLHIKRSIEIPEIYKDYTGFEINYTCGYIQNNTPSDVAVAILMIAATMYEVREDVSYGVNAFAMPFSSKALLDRYRLPNSLVGF